MEVLFFFLVEEGGEMISGRRLDGEPGCCLGACLSPSASSSSSSCGWMKTRVDS